MKEIAAADLRQMKGQKILILKGCSCNDYARGVISEYVNITGPEKPDITQVFGGME